MRATESLRLPETGQEPHRMHCANCGHDVVEMYCARCGQRRRPGRLRMGLLLREAADVALNLNSGLLHTVFELLRRPGPMVRDYLDGRRSRYTNPAKYLLICGAVTTFISIVSGFSGASANELAAVNPDAADQAAMVMGMLHRYFNLILILGLPLLPLLTWIFFRPTPFTFTEHLVFNTYVYAQQNLFWIAVLPLFFWMEDALLTTLVYLSVITVYYLWASRRFFGFGVLSTILRGTAVTVLFTLLFLAGVGAAMVVAL